MGDVKDLFTPNRRITVEYASRDGRLFTLLTRIERVDEMSLVLADPDQVRLPFGPEDAVVLSMDDEIHTVSAHSSFVERDGTGGLVFARPSDVNRYPKRRFLRVAVDLPILIDWGRRQRSTGRVADLSGSGLLARVNGRFDIAPGDLVEARLDLPKMSIPLYLKVVRRQTIGEREMSVAFDFHAIRPQQQDHIIEYILRRQRETVEIVRSR